MLSFKRESHHCTGCSITSGFKFLVLQRSPVVLVYGIADCYKNDRGAEYATLAQYVIRNKYLSVC